jgi:hypothetical protein
VEGNCDISSEWCQDLGLYDDIQRNSMYPKKFSVISRFGTAHDFWVKVVSGRCGGVESLPDSSRHPYALKIGQVLLGRKRTDCGKWKKKNLMMKMHRKISLSNSFRPYQDETLFTWRWSLFRGGGSSASAVMGFVCLQAGSSSTWRPCRCASLYASQQVLMFRDLKPENVCVQSVPDIPL